jgi:hypothetical protein
VLRVTVFFCLASAAGVLACWVAAGCSGQLGDTASPRFEGGATVDVTVGDAGAQTDSDGSDGAIGYKVCPDSIDASFGSIESNLLGTTGCVSNCHGQPTQGMMPLGYIDFQEDASFVYAELLGDGGGELSVNSESTPPNLPINRVTPFDPDASMLYQKLILTSFSNTYGSGMPLGGLNGASSVCPAAVDAVRVWIMEGAPFGVDAGTGPKDAGGG